MGVLVVAVLALIGLAITGRSDDCHVGRSLLHARMLDEAVARLDRGGCRADVADVGRSRGRAADAFARAHVYMAAGADARPDAAAATVEGTATEANRRALTADLVAASSLVAGLKQDPFRDDESAPLNATIARLAADDRAGSTCALAARLVDAGLLAQAEQALGQIRLPGGTCDVAYNTLRE